MPKAIDVLGERFGRLVVVAYEGKSKKDHRRMWRARCDCGNEILASSGAMRAGNPLSCGCRQREAAARSCRNRSITHGMTGHRLYNIWHTMRQRCEYEKHIGYAAYGGRGIKVCEEWQSFKSFRDWSIENGYGSELQIDRIDNDGGYSPENCRWVTSKQNTRNKKNNRLLTAAGETLTVSEWSDRTGIGVSTILYRLNAGHDDEMCLNVGRINRANQCAAKTIPGR